MSVNHRYGHSTFGGSTVVRQSAPGGINVPNYRAVFYWSVSAAGSAYGQSAFGGRRTGTYPSAGLFASPDDLAGTVTLPLWWAFAHYVNIDRVDPSGNHTPVRGASPFRMTGVSRRNASSNPKARDGLTGYTAGGNTTLSQLTGLFLPTPYVTTGVRTTATAAGSTTVTASLDAASVSTATYGFWARTSALATDIQVSIQWYDRTSSSLGNQTYSVPTVARTQAVGAFSWAVVTVSSMPNNAVTGVISYVATGLPAGGTFDITGRITELGAQLNGPYFDGDFPGASWVGTVGLSFSDISPILYALDGEAPMDVPVHYEMSNPEVPGYVATTQVVTLNSGGNRTWLTHPAQPFYPIQVEILGPFGPLDRDVVQGVYYPLDSTDGLPIVKTQSRRRGRTGTVKFLAINHDMRDRLNNLFADGSPVLIRPPAGYGEGSSMWLSLGKTTEDQGAYWSESDYRTITAPFYEVAAPLTANVTS